MITELTKKQEAALPRFAEKWLKIGLSTEPCNFEAAKEAAKKCYRLAGLEEPELFLGPFNNPIEGAIAHVMLKKLKQAAGKGNEKAKRQAVDKVVDQVWDQVEGKVLHQVWTQVDDQIFPQVRNKVSEQVRDQVRGQVRVQVKDQVWDQVDDQVRSQVWDLVDDQIKDQVWDQVWDQVKDQVRIQVWKCIDDISVALKETSINYQACGSQSANWLSFYDAMEFIGVEGLEPMRGLVDMAKCCGWWTPLKGACIFQHRPEEIHFDDRQRLHNLNGPAIKFRGEPICNVYAIHGVRVDQAIVEGKFGVKEIDEEENAEIRRVMIDIYGKDRYITDSGLEPIQTDDWGELYIKELTNDEPLMMVKVVNSTPEPDGSFKDYWLRVDPNAYGGIKTAHAAVASTFRDEDGSMIFKKPEHYQPLQET